MLLQTVLIIPVQSLPQAEISSFLGGFFSVFACMQYVVPRTRTVDRMVKKNRIVEESYKRPGEVRTHGKYWCVISLSAVQS